MPSRMMSVRRILHALAGAAVAGALGGSLGGCIGFSGGVETTERAEAVSLNPAADEALRQAQSQITRGGGEEAFHGLLEWFHANTSAAEGYDEALYLAALALIEDGHRIKAFYYLEELLDEHPASGYYQPAARLQYDIALSYLEGNADRMLIFPERHYDEAIEMLFRVQLRLPGSELAEDALLRTADFYFEQGDFDFAEDAYFVFADRFPRSPNVPVARLKQAFSNLKQYEGPAYDLTPLIDARTQLAQFEADFPQLAREQNLNRLFEWIDEQFAQKLLIQASFYNRTDRPESARLLLAGLVENHPDTRANATARRRLGTLGRTLPAPVIMLPDEAVAPASGPTTRGGQQ